MAPLLSFSKHLPSEMEQPQRRRAFRHLIPEAGRKRNKLIKRQKPYYRLPVSKETCTCRLCLLVKGNIKKLQSMYKCPCCFARHSALWDECKHARKLTLQTSSQAEFCSECDGARLHVCQQPRFPQQTHQDTSSFCSNHGSQVDSQWYCQSCTEERKWHVEGCRFFVDGNDKYCRCHLRSCTRYQSCSCRHQEGCFQASCQCDTKARLHREYCEASPSSPYFSADAFCYCDGHAANCPTDDSIIKMDCICKK
jgi:hypothetical protein